MFFLGLLTVAVTALVCWVSGDWDSTVNALAREGKYSNGYGIAAAVGVYMMFEPLRRALWGSGKKKGED